MVIVETNTRLLELSSSMILPRLLSLPTGEPHQDVFAQWEAQYSAGMDTPGGEGKPVNTLLDLLDAVQAQRSIKPRGGWSS